MGINAEWRGPGSFRTNGTSKPHQKIPGSRVIYTHQNARSGGVTGTILAGSLSTLTLNTAVGLNVGSTITIAGVSGIKYITALVGLAATLNTAANTAVSAAAVAYSAPTFVSEGNL